MPDFLRKYLSPLEPVDFGFIIGTGRCGTGMLSQALNAHSKICIPFELQILFEYCHNGKKLYEMFSKPEIGDYTANDFIKLFEQWSPHRFEDYFDYQDFLQEQIYPVKNLQAFVQDFYSAIARHYEKQIFMEQTPWYGQRIDVLKQLFPAAKYIHLIRDGRDVALSYARTPWWHDDIAQNMKRWCKEVEKIREDAEMLLGSSQYLEVRYEDFLISPESGLQKICEFIGIDFQDAMLDGVNHIDYQSWSKFHSVNFSSKAYNNWRKDKKSAFFTESLNAWKRHETFDFSRLPENVILQLKRSGYDA